MKHRFSIPALSVCFGAVGFLLRLLQNRTGFEPDTGLPIPGSVPAILLPILLMAAALLLCPCTKAAAQTDATFTQYYNVPTYYNPAAVGQTDLLRIRGGARLQWLQNLCRHS